jgi:hypothetical protein
LPTAVYDAEAAAADGLRIVVALGLELGDDSRSEAALSVVGIDHH